MIRWLATVAAGRDAAFRASWSATIVVTAPTRMNSSGSPASWPLEAAEVRCLIPQSYTRIGKLAIIFRNTIASQDGAPKLHKVEEVVTATRAHRRPPGLTARRGYSVETVRSLSVMNSSRAGWPCSVTAMPRLSAATMSPGSVIRSP